MKLIFLLFFLPICYGNICPRGEYWSLFSEICVKCTVCKPHEITIKTCQSHKDTTCASILKTSNHNKWDSNKKNHHFEEGKLHYINDENSEEILDNSLHYPSLELEVKHKHNNNNKHANKKQRLNDKFLKWDEFLESEDDDDYELKKHGKYNDYNKAAKGSHHNYNKNHHHHSDSSEIDEDYNDDKLQVILNKNSHNLWNSKKWKDESRKAQNRKKAARLAQLEDEKKLEEWLIQSRKQFKDRKDNLLKTLKEEQLDSYESEKRIRLNYPLINNRFADTIKDSNKINEKINKKEKEPVESEVELFKELIKDEESQEMELATLMSNKKDTSLHYKSVTPSHRMFLGAPSDIDGNIKDPQEVIKEEMGKNILYEKPKFSIVPIGKNELPLQFTAAERLIWDWQAVAIVSAIAACILFFLVITIFILLNARQWRKDNKSFFNTECEEMSTRVALIQPSLESSAAEGNNTNRFLQQFLAFNDEIKKEKVVTEDIQKN